MDITHDLAQKMVNFLTDPRTVGSTAEAIEILSKLQGAADAAEETDHDKGKKELDPAT